MTERMNLQAAAERMKQIAIEAGADTVLIALAGHDGNDLLTLDATGGDLIRLAGVGASRRSRRPTPPCCPRATNEAGRDIDAR